MGFKSLNSNQQPNLPFQLDSEKVKLKTSLVTVDNLSVNLGDRAILKGISLQVESGECVAILGASGCGKSTLLKSIIGLVEPDNGCVTVNGVVMGPNSSTSLRRKIGYSVQDGGLFPHLNVLENVVLMAKILKWTKVEISNRVDELIQLTRLQSELLRRYPAQLSGGQRQRVSLIRALFLDPSLILLDEPLGALDPIVRSELQEDLKAIFRSLNKAVLFVTHDLSEATFLSNRLVLMKDGEILQVGQMIDFIRRPSDAFVSKFIYSQKNYFMELIQ